jgi:hypothetical protein
MREPAHRRLLLLLSAAILLSGCGNDKTLPQLGFVNRTQHTDEQLQTLWKSAQQELSQQIDLNPVQRVLSNASPELLPGDPRVWSISPHQLIVSSQPDASSAQLLAATGLQRPDPTGLIACPQPCNVHYAPAYSLYSPPVSRYAASWEVSGNNFDFMVQYEFENQILKALGYDMSWR